MFIIASFRFSDFLLSYSETEFVICIACQTVIDWPLLFAVHNPAVVCGTQLPRMI